MAECECDCQYRAALEAMRDLVLIKGPESRLLWANRAFRDYYGMTGDELQDLIDGPQSDPDDTLQYVRDDRTVFDTGDHLDVPSEMITDATGRSADFRTIKSPIVDGGQVVRSVGVSRRNDDLDISSRAVSHIDAKAMVKPLRLLTSAFPLAIALVDVHGLVVSTSQLWRTAFGVGDAPHSHLTRCHPQLSPLAHQLTEALEEDRTSLDQIELPDEDGHRIFDVRVGPWHYDDGSTGGAMILALDVTEEADRQAELAASTERYDLVVEGASVGIWDWPDVTTDDEYWSDRFYALLGYEPGDVPASLSAFREALHPDDRQRTFDLVEEHLATDATFDLEYRLRGKSGGYRWYRGSGKAARDENGDPTRMVGSIQDIDARVQAERAVRRVNEDLEHFVHVAAHDLREPARRQILLTELMLSRYGDSLDADLRRQLKQLQDQGRKMLAMVTGFRSLTGIAGPTLEVEKVDLCGLVEDLVTEIVDPTAGVDVTVDLPNKVLGYPTLLEILFRNLIRNALTHGSQPLVLRISELEGDDRPVFAVSNTFDGDLSSAGDDHLFKPFVQSDRNTEGSGLGLSICRRVVERHRGRIWIEPADDDFRIHFTLGDQE